MLRNRLFLLSLSVLTACAPLATPRSNASTPQGSQLAATPAVAPVQPVSPAQPVAAVQTELKPLSTATPTPASTTPATLPAATSTPPAARQNDVWQRIRDGYAMPEMDSKKIAHYEKWYANQPEYMERMTERARRYLYFITEEVEKRGMPTEIALLPMIESAFNPGAYSGARASGIWQFIPSTGKNFGMQQNWWYDGRRDVISATNGALDYLQKLHAQFGAWDLALAAYNCGERSVMKAQAHNRKRHLPTNYASLKLPKETRFYVPKLLAVKNIIAYPMSFGLVLPELPNQPYFAPVTTSRHIDVKLAAEMAEISMDEFAALNPGHNRPVILQDKDNMILLPVEKVDVFRANLEKASQPLVSWQEYQPKKGEKIDELATRFGIAADKLKSVNGLSPRIKECTGQPLLVPVTEGETAPEFEAFNTHLAPTDPFLLNAVSHTVRRGDTLSSIARRYHVKLASLKSWNRGVRILRPGQHILVAQAAAKPRRISRTTKDRAKVASRVNS